MKFKRHQITISLTVMFIILFSFSVHAKQPVLDVSKDKSPATFVDKNGDGINDGSEYRFRHKNRGRHSLKNRNLNYKKGAPNTDKATPHKN
ncbi:MAG: hypothetical protein JXR91_03690 [Deltaproteobacteria bacterium]|nr:hypothetical protein [Deltaproteobacteria bacterium]